MGPWRCLAFQWIGNPQVCFKCLQNKGFLCFHWGRPNRESQVRGGSAWASESAPWRHSNKTLHCFASLFLQTAIYSKLVWKWGQEKSHGGREKQVGRGHSSLLRFWGGVLLGAGSFPGLFQNLAAEKPWWYLALQYSSWMLTITSLIHLLLIFIFFLTRPLTHLCRDLRVSWSPSCSRCVPQSLLNSPSGGWEISITKPF